MTTVAGNGSIGFSGDGNLATLAYLNSPTGVAVDVRGNIYIADQGSSRIRKVDVLSGRITTVAGTGTSGYSGDGGPAASAKLNGPVSITVDTSGNLFISDEGNQRVRKITTDGIINTIAGTGIAGYSGDGMQAKNATLNRPTELALDADGNLYIADRFNSSIRKINRTTGIISTVAGNGHSGYFASQEGGPATAAFLDNPMGVTFDPNGNMYISDQQNSIIRKVSVSTGTITTIAGMGNVHGYIGNGDPMDGSATLAKMREPVSSAIDRNGNLYISDRSSDRILKVRTDGLLQTIGGYENITYSGDGANATGAQLHYPGGMAVDTSGNLYIADYGNSVVRKVAVDGTISTFAGTGFDGSLGDGGVATRAQLALPIAVILDKKGNVYISEYNGSRVRIVTPDGIINTIAGNGVQGFSGDGGPALKASLYGPTGLAIDMLGNLYIADQNNNRVRKVDASTKVITTVVGAYVGGYSGDGGPASAATINMPTSVSTDANNNIYFADYYNGCIRKIDASTGIISTIMSQLGHPSAVALDSKGNVYAASGSNDIVRRLDIATNQVTTIAGNGSSGYQGDGGLSTSASLYVPNGLAIDASGSLYISELGNNDIRKVCFSKALPELAATDTARFAYVNSVGSPICLYNGCDNIALLVPSGTNPVLGNILARSWRESSQPQNFVSRHYEVAPLSNTATSTGTLTLYFSQSDLDSFNKQVPTPSRLLPTGPSDAPGKARLLIEQRIGFSTTGTGLPASYTGTTLTFDPPDNNIVWNALIGRWEITLSVTGFGGYFVKTQTSVILPLTLLDFSGLNFGNSNLLTWTTSHESNISGFFLESSPSGNNFTTISSIQTTGDGVYRFTDEKPLGNPTFYRLKMIDIDGSVTYSKIISIQRPKSDLVTIFPNPAITSITLSVDYNSQFIGTKIDLVDEWGRLLKQSTLNSYQQRIDMGGLGAGLYYIKMKDGSTVKIIKQDK